MSEADGRVACMKDLLNKGGGPGKGGPGFILPKPKPKPKSNSIPALAATKDSVDGMDGMDESSPPVSPTSPDPMVKQGVCVCKREGTLQWQVQEEGDGGGEGWVLDSGRYIEGVGG